MVEIADLVSYVNMLTKNMYYISHYNIVKPVLDTESEKVLEARSFYPKAKEFLIKNQELLAASSQIGERLDQLMTLSSAPSGDAPSSSTSKPSEAAD